MLDMQTTMHDVAAWYPQVIRKHRTWLASFPPEHLRAWKESFHSNAEVGVFEACVRELLEQHTDGVEPAQELDVGGPDFLCSVGKERFYVVAACLMMETVREHTGLPADLEPRARTYRDLTALIRKEMMDKGSRCIGLDAPCLLAVGTFHSGGSILCGEELQVQNVLTSAAGPWMPPDAERGGAASGILVCGFGCRVWRLGWPVRGILRPAAWRPFRRELLPGIRFCGLEPGHERGRPRVRWG
jgi:hypothetical protein